MTDKTFTLQYISSLEKIFADEFFYPEEILTSDTMLMGERYSFQAAYCLENARGPVHARVEASGPLAEYVQIRRVGLAPSEFPNYPDGDSFVLRTTPGLYPDPLYDFDGTVPLLNDQWRSLWITIPAQCPLPSGTYDLTLTFTEKDIWEKDTSAEKGQELGSCTFSIHRINARLQPQTLIHTQWFHTDCIADWYQAPVFSERYWELVEKYMSCAVTYGINMILTPLFTPPLDTAPGGERTTVQLVDVYRTGSGYEFGFERLNRWIRLCDRCGIRCLEFSHLFTQWGAEHAPKIMAYEGAPGAAAQGAPPVRIFGWDTDSGSDEYREFLDAFLPRLTDFIREHGLEERCYFHVSDEPHREHLPNYLRARELVKRHIGKMPIMDALSDYEYYEQGLVEIPVCCNDHMEPFLDHQVPGMWTYYSCSQYKEVSNRFFCMPSIRSRILGVQMYQYEIQGFLQWGFNFWNTFLSRRSVNPFCVTDAGCAFPSGDAFLVYPGEDGPIGSLRAEVFMEGLQDMRMLKLLESLTDRETVMELIEEDLDRPLTFRQYPHDIAWLMNLRGTCHEMIEELTDMRKADGYAEG